MTDVHDHVRELTRTHIVQAEYHTDDGTRWHYTNAPALLNQLATATRPEIEGGGGGHAGSRPVAYLESLDTLMHIDQQAAAWVRRLGDDDPGDTTACVRRVGALYPNTDERTQKNIARDIRSWWTQARVVTGWDSAAWRPANSCPLCEVKGGLRVKLSTHTAVCIECRGTWEPDTLGLLADHIRSENQEDAA